LALYFLFWCFSGLNLVLTGTLQGKLISPHRRGRLIAASVFGSVAPAVGFAWWLLPGWLEAPVPGYDKIFGFTGVCFAIAAGVALFLDERPDDNRHVRSTIVQQLRSAWQVLRKDHDYRRIVVVASLFSSSIMVFPHYQALARDRLDLVGSNLMVWVVVQNISMGVASLLVGPLADRFGNRLALRLLTFSAAGIPLLALWLTTLDVEVARAQFLWVFVGIGLIPIGFRVITNYVLEIAPAEDHARYLSLYQLCTAAAFLASPVFGLLIDVTSFELVFGLEAALMLVGAVLTFGLVEPRNSRR
jgi:MFS family permease